MVKVTGKKRESASIVGSGVPGPGRPKGSTNKTTALLKDAILKAAENAGDGDLTTYLTKQARDNPTAFMTLLGKVLPMQIAGDPDNPIEHNHTLKARDMSDDELARIASIGSKRTSKA